MFNCGLRVKEKEEFIKLRTAYYGYVDLPVKKDGDYALMECKYKNTKIKIIDDRDYKLNHNIVYSLSYLNGKQPAKIKLDNKDDGLIDRCPVDCLFSCYNYFEFLDKILKTKLKTDLIICIVNIKDLDNAYYNGSYMLFGSGKNLFKPLTTIDITFHELTHSLTHQINNLEYKNESGALNESFSDIIAYTGELYIYKKYNLDENPNNDIEGEADDFIGEDATLNMRYLRNMRNPELNHQPKYYNGRFWYNGIGDNGGVHINSGVINYLGYLIYNEMGDDGLKLMFRVFKKLNRNSNFKDFARKLRDYCYLKDIYIIDNCLKKVGLSNHIIYV